MTAVAVDVITPDQSAIGAIRARLDREIDDLLAILPDPALLTADARRGIVARYTAVLEGNFIYWMTAAYLSAQSDQARAKIIDNLREEVCDAHPAMLRRFATAASAVPTDSDTVAVDRDLTKVRLFVGRIAPVHNIVTMAFFEGFIQRFMPFLADLARLQGSAEFEYTDVHGVCDIAHTEELFRALDAELALAPRALTESAFDGVALLRRLVGSILGHN